MKTNEISNSQDIIDSRDIIARIKELESDLQSVYDEIENENKPTFEDWLNEIITNEDNELPVDEARKYQALKKLADEASGYSEDWNFGAALIRDDYMEDYAREFAEDIGAISKDTQWPATCIDWEKATDEFKQDYTEVDFDGVSYWVR